ncbi:MAG: LacI family transcriptional regulator GalR [Rhodobacteraceae bacterium HLUCCA08]|nr:MAG: LacI family transcriptional regulator GalR [Rhodobacteraceae bacterium HLUCCA08]
MNLKDLSRQLGLSPTTVSRALNGYPEVSEATRKRVVEAARAHNYSPNARAKSLATGRSYAIGHVIPLSTRHEMVNPIFGDFIAGAGETYGASGYDMLLSVVEDGAEESAYRSMRARHSVDGVVVHGPRVDDPRITMLHQIGLPFVVHGRSSRLPNDYCWLDVNNTSAFRRATEFLIDLGHRRIALVNGLEEMDFAHRRRQGYEEALRGRGIAIDPALTFSEEMTEYYGFRTADRLLARDDAPSAFLVSSLISALGVRRAIQARGLEMGRDVSIITHDDALSYMDNGNGEVPIFTATRSSVRQAGARLAQMLIDRIEGRAADTQQVLFEAELRVGQSTGPAPTP